MIKEKHCLRCGHDWLPRVEDPRECPRCKTPYWNVKRKSKKTKEELNAEPISKGSADALNKSSGKEILKPAIDSTQSENGAGNGAGNGPENDLNNGLKSDSDNVENGVKR